MSAPAASSKTEGAAGAESPPVYSKIPDDAAPVCPPTIMKQQNKLFRPFTVVLFVYMALVLVAGVNAISSSLYETGIKGCTFMGEDDTLDMVTSCMTVMTIDVVFYRPFFMVLYGVMFAVDQLKVMMVLVRTSGPSGAAEYISRTLLNSPIANVTTPTP